MINYSPEFIIKSQKFVPIIEAHQNIASPKEAMNQ